MYWVSQFPSRFSSSQVLRVSATDADLGENGVITYSLLTDSGEEPGEFAVEPTTGVVLTNSTVRFEPGRPERQLVLVASDGGRPPRTAAAAVLLRVQDINNHAPEFDKSVYK